MEIAKEPDGLNRVNQRIAEAGDEFSEAQYAQMRIDARKTRDEYLNPRRQALNERWSERLAGIEAGIDSQGRPFDLARIRNERAVLRGDKSAFEASDHMREWERRMNQLNEREEELLRGRSGGSSSANVADANVNWMNESFREWSRGRIDRNEMWSRFNSIQNSFTTAEERKAYYDLIGRTLKADDGSVETQTAFENFNVFADSVKMPQHIRNEFERNLIEMRANGCTPDKMVEYMDSVKNETIAKMIARTDSNPNQGFRREEWRELNAASYEGNLGHFDFPFASENQLYEIRDIPGASDLQQNLIRRNKTVIENQLRGTGWQVVSGYAEKSGVSAQGKEDHTGRVLFEVRNGERTETVILNPNDRLEKLDKSSFDSERSAGRSGTWERHEERRAETVRRVEESIPTEARNRIADAMSRAVDSSWNMDFMSVVSNFRRQLERELGDNTNETYIEAKIQELTSHPDFARR
jgi:hypothetical protein